MQVVRVRLYKMQPEDEKQRGKRIRIIKKTARCIGICGEPSSCVTGSFGEFPATKNINVPMMRICGQMAASYRFFLKNSSAFRNMIPSASSFDIPFSRKYS